MLRANIGLSRKVSRDYCSSGYSVNIEGEITAGSERPEAMLEQIHRLFQLAEQALAREIDCDQGDQNIGREDDERRPREDRSNGSRPASDRPQPSNGDMGSKDNGHGESASNKQIQFLLSLGKRQGLSKLQLEGEIEHILGKRIDVYQLTKKEASRVIEALNNATPTNGRR